MQLRSGPESSQFATVLSGTGWRTDTETDISPSKRHQMIRLMTTTLLKRLADVTALLRRSHVGGLVQGRVMKSSRKSLALAVSSR